MNCTTNDGLFLRTLRISRDLTSGRLGVGCLFAALAAMSAVAQEASVVPKESGHEAPILRVDPAGPTSYVSALGFDPVNGTLLAGSWDKMVHAWGRIENRFVPEPASAVRVPMGPGTSGAINALAISPDGRLIALAGQGRVAGEAGFRQSGFYVPRKGGMTRQMQLEIGTIYVVDRLTGQVRMLRGHTGPVVALAFSADPGTGLALASAGLEYQFGADETKRPSVRLWDVAQGRHLAGIYVDPPNEKAVLRPQLAIRKLGAAPGAVMVAIAWWDGKLRIWNPATNPQQAETIADGFENGTVKLLPGGEQLVTSNVIQVGNAYQTRLRFWRVTGQGRLQADSQPPLTIPAARNTVALPRAVDLAQVPGGPLAAAVTLLVCQPGPAGFIPLREELQVCDLGQRRLLGRTLLWDQQGIQTVKISCVAFAGDGQRVAVGGSNDHSIFVFSTSELLQTARPPRAQKLANQASEFAEAYFVRRQNAWGIYLAERNATSGWIFDLAQRQLIEANSVNGWQPDRAPAGNWTVTTTDKQVTVRDPQGTTYPIRLHQDVERVTGTAILPASRGRDETLLAVAATDRGEPLLGLYHVETGNHLRQLTGHSAQINSLSFSSDGRLLLTTGQDDVVCAWSLTDLKQILGRRGRLSGVVVEDSVGDAQAANQVLVARVDDDSPARGQLAAGDVLLGEVDQAELKSWQAAQEFYWAWLRKSPGETMTLRVARDNQPARDVTLTAGQGVDERKPLFSLLVTRPAANQSRQWIGWHPVGPFESSDERIEQYLGWHFNTGDPNRPTAFADLNQYRAEYYREGLLRDLVEFGALMAARDAGPLPPPVMSLTLPQLGLEAAAAGDVLVIQDPVQAELSLDLNFDFPLKQINQIECAVDGQVAGPMQRTDQRGWKFDLSRLAWSRAARTITVVLTTNERQPQQFQRELTVRYQPPAPQVQIASPTLDTSNQATVADGQLALRAQVVPPKADEPVEVVLSRVTGEQRTVLERWQLQQAGPITSNLSLQEGLNEFELAATNREATDETRARETTVEALRITRSPQPVLPPKLALVIAEPHRTTENVRHRQTVAAQSARFVLRGEMTNAPDDVSVILIGRRANASREQVVPTIRADGKVTFAADLQHEDPLNALQLDIEARQGDQVVSTQTVTVRYEPPLPQLDIVLPGEQERVIPSDQPQRSLDLTARYDFPPGIDVPDSIAERLRFQADVNQEGPIDAAASVANRTVAGRVQVTEGKNDLRVLAHYDWNPARSSRSDPVPVTVMLRPQVAVEYQKQVGEVDLVGVVKIDTPRLGGLFIRDKEVPPDEIVPDPVSGGFVARVPISAEEPDLPLTAEIHVPGMRAPFVYPLPNVLAPVNIMSPPPEIQFLAPARSDKTVDPDYTLRFEVRSSAPLTRLELRQAGSPILTETADALTAWAVQKDDQLIYERTLPARLQIGINQFELVAANAFGDKQVSVTIARSPQPIRIKLDGLSRRVGGELVPFVEGQPLEFDQPLAFLRGRVIWSARDERLEQQLFVNVAVNGFQQIGALRDAKLNSQEGTFERELEVPILLSRQTNRLTASAPDLEESQAELADRTVNCQNPNERYRLHLFVLGVGENADGDQLVGRVMSILDAQRDPKQNGALVTPVFRSGIDLNVATNRNLAPNRVKARLLRIERTIRRSMEEDPRSQHVVIIYYTGGEFVQKEHLFLLTTNNNPNLEIRERDSIRSDTLTEFVGQTPGAHLLLLDVARQCAETKCPPADWPLRSPGAVLRFAWLLPEKKPSEAELLTALSEFQPEDNELRDFDQRLSLREARVLQTYPNSMSYERYIPEGLRDLKLRSEP